MRVISKSPFDYVTLSSLVSSLILMMSQVIAQKSRCSESLIPQWEPLTACGRAGAQGSEGTPAVLWTQW